MPLASYVNLAKNPDSITTGAGTVDANNLVTSAAVVWPDGKPGTLTITSRDANNAVLAYNILTARRSRRPSGSRPSPGTPQARQPMSPRSW